MKDQQAAMYGNAKDTTALKDLKEDGPLIAEGERFF